MTGYQKRIFLSQLQKKLSHRLGHKSVSPAKLFKLLASHSRKGDDNGNNSTKTLKYLEKAAIHGDVESMYELGKIGPPETRLHWLNRAALFGDDNALLEYAAQQKENGDVEGSMVSLVRCIQRSSNRELKGKALFQLGSLYLESISLNIGSDEKDGGEDVLSALEESDTIENVNEDSKASSIPQNINNSTNQSMKKVELISSSHDQAAKSDNLNIESTPRDDSSMQMLTESEDKAYYADLAVRCFEEGIVHQSQNSMCALADCYMKGLGVSKNERNGFKLYLTAAEQGHPLAQFEVHRCLINGIGTKASESDAAYWLEKAADNDFDQALYELGNCLLNGKLNFKKDLQKAFGLFQKGSQYGNVNCQYSLAKCLHLGYGCEKNEVEATKWFTEASLGGHPEAQHQLGFRYETGLGIERNFELAFEWYELASRFENTSAIYDLGRCYENGIGISVSDFKAFTQYSRAASLNHPAAMMNLIRCYSQGIGVNQNLEKAFEVSVKCSEFYPPAKYLRDQLQQLLEYQNGKRQRIRKSRKLKRKVK